MYSKKLGMNIWVKRNIWRDHGWNNWRESGKTSGGISEINPGGTAGGILNWDPEGFLKKKIRKEVLKNSWKKNFRKIPEGIAGEISEGIPEAILAWSNLRRESARNSKRYYARNTLSNSWRNPIRSCWRNTGTSSRIKAFLDESIKHSWWNIWGIPERLRGGNPVDSEKNWRNLGWNFYLFIYLFVL